MKHAPLPESEDPRDQLLRLINAEEEALSDLKQLLWDNPHPRPSRLALQVALCNRCRLLTIAGLEKHTGHDLQRVTPPVFRTAASTADSK